MNTILNNFFKPISIESIGRFMIIILLLEAIFFSYEIPITISIASIITPSLLLISLTILVILLILKQKSVFQPPYKNIFILITGIIILQTIRGFIEYDNMFITLRHAASYLYILIIYYMLYFFKKWKDIVFFTKILFYATTISCIIQLFFFFSGGIGGHLHFSKMIGYYGFQGMALFLLFFLFAIAKSPIEKLILIISGSVILSILILGEYRGAWVALIISILLMLFLSIKVYGWNLINTKKILIGIVIVLSFIGIILISKTNINFYNKITATLLLPSSGREDTLVANNTLWRAIAWQDMTNEWLKKPIIGYGMGSIFKSQTLTNLGWFDFDGQELAVHNSHLSTLYKLGLVGFLLIEYFYIKVLFNSEKYLIRYKINDNKRIFTISWISTGTFVFIISMTDVVIETGYKAILWWLPLGMLIISNKFMFTGHQENGTPDSSYPSAPTTCRAGNDP